jgi:hypothetical protein
VYGFCKNGTQLFEAVLSATAEVSDDKKDDEKLRKAKEEIARFQRHSNSCDICRHHFPKGAAR